MIYLDNAATSYPKPKCVQDAVTRCFADWGGNPGRSGHSLALSTASAIYSAREAVAAFLGAQGVEQVIFTSNATHAINLVLRAHIKKGEHILISDLEHNAVYRPLWRMQEDDLITFSLFSHKGDILENIRNACTPETGCIVCTHVSNVNGFVFPIKEIGDFCQKSGIFFIVDASQSVGHFTLSLNDFYCDALFASGHKGMMGIQGGGVLYLRSSDGLTDVFQGGSGVDSHLPTMPEYLPDRFEVGTIATPAIVSMGAGVRWLTHCTINHVHKHIVGYNDMLYMALKNIEGVRLCSEKGSCILSFSIDNTTSEEVAYRLDQKGIAVRGGLHCAPLAHISLGSYPHGVVRVSPSVFSSFKNIPFLIDAIFEIAKGRS